MGCAPGIDELRVGGDRAENSCIGSAGYTWCELKGKCLRTWEEPCKEAEDSCNIDVDCVPFPECHPKSCINILYQDNYEQPQICTMEYREDAAYSPEDCICVENRCTNKNLVAENIDSFEQCVSAGYPVMESHPRQCQGLEGITFVEELCIDQCGDSICQEVVCQGSGCPCAETEQDCPEDCS